MGKRRFVMKNTLKNYANLLIMPTLVLIAASTAAFSANATITKEEWAVLMQNPAFKEADKKLGEAYKKAAAALPEADRQALLKEQRAWAAKRERDAFANFDKGTSDYARALIDMAHERIAVLERYQPKALKFAQTVKFKGKSIPITIFGSTEPAGEIMGEHTKLDSLVFVYDGVKQTVRLEDAMFNPNDLELVEVDDCNFDNYMDIVMFSASGSGGIWNNIYIYNPQTKSYAFHAELSALPDVLVNAKTQTVQSHGKNGHAGMLYTVQEFKWERGKLKLIYEEKQVEDETTEGQYIRTTRTLKNGKWVEASKGVTVDDM
jgi:uncharacterized protein YecT (DUF1311 family)